MIECTESYIYYTDKKKVGKKRRSRFRRLFVFLSVAACFALLFYQINFASFDLVFGICERESEKSALNAVNAAINDTLKDEVRYVDLISVERDNNGDVVFITANSYKINTLCRAVATETEKLLTEELQKGCKVPLLAFTGLKFFSGLGVRIDYRAIRIGSVNCEFISDFSSVGINQTLHALYFRIDCEITVGFLYKNKSVTVNSDVLISESVLVGKVPEIYFNGKTV